jgi:hypothetical protein
MEKAGSGAEQNRLHKTGIVRCQWCAAQEDHCRIEPRNLHTSQ